MQKGFPCLMPPSDRSQARDDSEREAGVAEWYRGPNLLVGRYCYPLRHKSRRVRGTRVPIRWFLGAIVVVQAIRHVRCMSAIYRALIEPLLDQVRRIPKRRESPVPAPDGLGVALGGGFARGFAHVGVLQVLEENQIPISYIAGTSVGSILGGAYASGVPVARMASICRKIQLYDFGRWKLS